MKRSNIWYFDINDEGDRQVKNEQSLRRVPVHPEVQALGFLEYVETSACGATIKMRALRQSG